MTGVPGTSNMENKKMYGYKGSGKAKDLHAAQSDGDGAARR